MGEVYFKEMGDMGVREWEWERARGAHACNNNITGASVKHCGALGEEWTQ